jgi:hypothetical protein
VSELSDVDAASSKICCDEYAVFAGLESCERFSALVL